MVNASYISRPLRFKRPSGTSRGVLVDKPCWYIRLGDERGSTGLGEVSLIPGLSIEDPEEIEIQLDHVCKLISNGQMVPSQPLPALPGIQFALESALLDLKGGGKNILFASDFTEGKQGIRTNGLIWMGDRSYMKEQIRLKLDQGFRVLKMKVGALELKEELEIVQWIRSQFGAADLELRLDANGAWSPREAPSRLSRFAELGIHSIEQPIQAGQHEAMAALCSLSIIPIALDEELIGITAQEEKRKLLKTIKPDFVILKPGLLGGFSLAQQWIEIAGNAGIGWWITSALESSIGLNAIAQWTFHQKATGVQGLGTGMIYQNNIPSPLRMEGDQLWYRSGMGWEIPAFPS